MHTASNYTYELIGNAFQFGYTKGTSAATAKLSPPRGCKKAPNRHTERPHEFYPAVVRIGGVGQKIR